MTALKSFSVEVWAEGQGKNDMPFIVETQAESKQEASFLAKEILRREFGRSDRKLFVGLVEEVRK